MSETVKFGTDGIRGRVGCFPITPESFLKLGWALGTYLSQENTPASVVLGRDPRLSGNTLSLAFCAGVLSAGVDVIDAGVLPTPAVSYLTKSLNAQAGAVISASHNKYSDNGLKLFNEIGLKFSTAQQNTLVNILSKNVVLSEHMGHMYFNEDAKIRYIEFLKSTFPKHLDLKGLRIVLDMANGASSHIGPQLLKELGATVIPLACEPDGLNINEACGATSLDMLRRHVLEENAECGIALDGDGDRLMMVDHLGQVIDGDECLWIIVNGAWEQGHLKGGVVGTQMSNLGQELAFEKLNIPYVRAAVGDAHVMRKMLDNNWDYGGEGSGHIICRHHGNAGDGLMSALQVLAEMVRQEKSVRDLAGTMKKFPQVLRSIPLEPNQRGIDFTTDKSFIKILKDAQAILGRAGRILVRPSGTEPILRVMVEGEDEPMVQHVAQNLVDELSLVCQRLCLSDD